MAKRPRGRPQKWGGTEEDAQVFTLRLPRSLHAALRTYANLKGIAVNEVVLNAIHDFWRGRPEAGQIERLVRDAAAERPSGRRPPKLRRKPQGPADS